MNEEHTFQAFTDRASILSNKVLNILNTEEEEIGVAALFGILATYAQNCDPVKREVLVLSLKDMTEQIETGQLFQESH